jgi:hypothetical protein
MIALETRQYQNRNTDLGRLRADIISYLQSDGFKIQEPKQGGALMLIQAQKGGFLRSLISAERALNVLIQGVPNDFSVQIGIGKWMQNIAVTAVETVGISVLFLPLDVTEMIWNVEVRDKIGRKVDELVRTQSQPATVPVPA